MRCDIAIIEGDEILFLFEVKESEPFWVRSGGRQRRAYSEAISIHGVPVFFVYGMDSIAEACVRAARALLPRRVPA